MPVDIGADEAGEQVRSVVSRSLGKGFVAACV